MSEQVTITKIFRDAVETKFGPGTKTTIYTQEHPDIKMSTFKKIPEWKEGDVVMVDIEKNGNFVNFKPASGESLLEARVKKLEDAVFGPIAPQSSKTAPQSHANSKVDVEYDPF